MEVQELIIQVGSKELLKKYLAIAIPTVLTSIEGCDKNS